MANHEVGKATEASGAPGEHGDNPCESTTPKDATAESPRQVHGSAHQMDTAPVGTSGSTSSELKIAAIMSVASSSEQNDAQEEKDKALWLVDEIFKLNQDELKTLATKLGIDVEDRSVPYDDSADILYELGLNPPSGYPIHIIGSAEEPLSYLPLRVFDDCED